MNQSNNFRCNKEPDRSWSQCLFHPNEIFVGVCPLCLSERLVTIASLKQRHYNKHRSQQQYCTTTTTRGNSFSLTTKFLALGSMLSRMEQQNKKTSSSWDSISSRSSSSQEDSFISIKFEENGAAFWDKDSKRDNTEIKEKTYKTMLIEPHVNTNSTNKKTNNINIIELEPTRPLGGRGTRPWRKRIVSLFDQIKWKTVGNTNTVT